MYQWISESDQDQRQSAVTDNDLTSSGLVQTGQTGTDAVAASHATRELLGAVSL